jgi:predicted pyridoxine 5'-phosphate oxidase superfamily flavin-nucleotide-binding protein
MLDSPAWWQVISNYNQSVFPLQLLIMLAGIITTIYLIYKSDTKSSAAMKGYLSFCNLWIGSIFFMALGKGFPSPLRQIQGMLFITIGTLFIIDVFINRTQLVIPRKGLKRNLTIISLLIVSLYPVIGIILGHPYNHLIYPGTFPCPTTAFTLILLANSLPRISKIIYILLLIWAIPFPPLIQIPKYHVYEDSIMFLAGVYALFFFIRFIVRSRQSTNLKINRAIFAIRKDSVFATASLDGIPNIVPIHSKHLISNTTILISDQFMNKTKNNILDNPYGVISIRDSDIFYTISGRCQYKTSGFLFKMAVRAVKKYARNDAKNKNIKLNCKGIIIMSVEKIEVSDIQGRKRV